jgi:2-polyprenyl-6-methoxyphenol hydroxylase-like FAD-dependent oxidoreductase
MAAHEVEVDVTIVGCGPVGCTLAILLAQQGHQVAVLERWPEPYSLPRAVHFDHEVARIFQSCGIGDRLRDITEPAHVYEWRNAAGTTLLRFGRLGDGASGWPESLMFNQPTLEALLEARARELPNLVIHRGAEVVALEDGPDGVVVRTPDGTESHARYLIGCDGANSAVRELAGLPVDDRGFFYDWLIVDVVLNEPRVFDPINVQICDPVRPTTAVSGGPGHRRWEFMRLPNETPESLNDVDRAWELLAPWDVRPSNARLERHAVYTFNARQAESWQAGSVFLAGDAAHLMPPFAGQGMCSGIRDAANLAWKLDHVLRGVADRAILGSYQAERLPSAQAAIEFSMELGKVICVADPAEAAARDEAMAAAVGPDLMEIPGLPPYGDGLIEWASPQAGHLFVQGTDDGQPFDLAHGVGWRLITIDPGFTLDPDQEKWFDSLGGRVVNLAEPDRTYERWFSEHEATFALQRPDFYLFGTAASPASALELLASLRRQLSTPLPTKETT